MPNVKCKKSKKEEFWAGKRSDFSYCKVECYIRNSLCYMLGRSCWDKFCNFAGKT